MEIGSRVGAILSADEKEVHLLGFGVYEGEFVPPADTPGMGKVLHEASIKNPRILLDSGSHVYGCECWWGAEEEVKAQLGDRKIIHTEIAAVRKEAAEEEAE